MTLYPRKRATNSFAGCSHTSTGDAELLDAAVVHDCDAVGERKSLVVIVCDVQRREPEAGEEVAQLDHQPLPQRAVERSERLVQHEQARGGRKRPRQRDALLLAARQLGDPPVLVPGQPDQREQLAGA